MTTCQAESLSFFVELRLCPQKTAPAFVTARQDECRMSNERSPIRHSAQRVGVAHSAACGAAVSGAVRDVPGLGGAGTSVEGGVGTKAEADPTCLAGAFSASMSGPLSSSMTRSAVTEDTAQLPSCFASHCSVLILVIGSRFCPLSCGLRPSSCEARRESRRASASASSSPSTSMYLTCESVGRPS